MTKSNRTEKRQLAYDILECFDPKKDFRIWVPYEEGSPHSNQKKHPQYNEDYRKKYGIKDAIDSHALFTRFSHPYSVKKESLNERKEKGYYIFAHKGDKFEIPASFYDISDNIAIKLAKSIKKDLGKYKNKSTLYLYYLVASYDWSKKFFWGIDVIKKVKEVRRACLDFRKEEISLRDLKEIINNVGENELDYLDLEYINISKKHLIDYYGKDYWGTSKTLRNTICKTVDIIFKETSQPKEKVFELVYDHLNFFLIGTSNPKQVANIYYHY